MNVEYDKKKNISYTQKVFAGDTDYYVGVTKVCPICKNSIIGYPAVSRKDNRTEICSACGIIEALQDFMTYKKIKPYEEKEKQGREEK